MIISRSWSMFILPVVVAILLSCSHTQPLSPDLSNITNQELSANVCATQSPNRAMLGFWTLYVPADRSCVEAIPRRIAEMHLNMVRILEGYVCDDCIQLGDFFVTSSDVLHVNVTLKHPFPGLDKYTGFDVRAIIITGSDYEFPESGRRISWNGNHVRVMAPDGYTQLFNPTEYPIDQPGHPALRYIPGHLAPGGDLTATLNPFISYMKDNDRRMFPSGAAETKVISIQLTPGDLELGYAVDACWTPIDEPVTDPLTDFPPEANCREAYIIFPHQGAGLTPLPGSSAPVHIDVWDHQGLDTISTVSIEAPDLFNGTMSLNISTATDESVLYTGMLTNELGAMEGDYPLLVRIIDWDADENLGQIDGWQVTKIKITDHGYPLNDLVYIPEGWFYMGCDLENDPEGDWHAEPGHMHPTGSYYIGLYEVTQREFDSFMVAGGYLNHMFWSDDGWAWRVAHDRTQPLGWDGYLEGRVNPEYPMQAQYYEAEAFCAWVGGRLPTEAEWERAARGDDDHRVYPWGDEWDPTLCWCSDNPEYYMGGPIRMPVGTFSPEGDSPWGLSDCMGNAYEMTSDWWTGNQHYFYEQYASGDFTPSPPPGPDESWCKVSRGGNCPSAIYYHRCADRWPIGDIRTYSTHDGFRVAYDAN